MTVPAEEGIRPLDRPFLQLGPPERAERDAAEQSGAERLHGHRQLGLVLAALRAASFESPASLVPRTELVRDIEHDRALARIAPPQQRRADVDEPHPETVAHPVAHAPRRREQEEQRMI